MIFVRWFFTEKVSNDRLKKVIDTITRLQEYVDHMTTLQIDDTEYAYLKTLVLFSPGENLILDQNLFIIFLLCNMFILSIF